MPRPHPPGIQKEKARGKTFWYYRADRKSKRIRLPDAYGSEEFKAAYKAAVAGVPPPPKDNMAISHGTFEWLVTQWKGSSDWLHTSESTKSQRENILDRIIAEKRLARVSGITESTIRAGREKRKDTPAAANNFLKTMRALFRWAVEAQHLKVNPAANVTLIPKSGPGFAPWTSADVLKYRDRWPLGTRQRVALEVLLWTGLRRGDACILGRQHMVEVEGSDIFMLRAEKTGVQLFIPLLPPLREALEKGPVGELTFIAGENRQRMVKESFGTWFREQCDLAGVSKSAHGLRKLAATLTANAGASELELQSLMGWTSTGQSEVYTREAARATLALSAAMKLAKNPLGTTAGKKGSGTVYSLTHVNVRAKFKKTK